MRVVIALVLLVLASGCATHYTCQRTDPGPHLERVDKSPSGEACPSPDGCSLLTIPCQGSAAAATFFWPYLAKLKVAPASTRSPSAASTPGCGPGESSAACRVPDAGH